MSDYLKITLICVLIVALATAGNIYIPKILPIKTINQSVFITYYHSFKTFTIDAKGEVTKNCLSLYNVTEVLTRDSIIFTLPDSVVLRYRTLKIDSDSSVYAEGYGSLVKFVRKKDEDAKTLAFRPNTNTFIVLSTNNICKR